jgi:hypothetical protein
MVELPERYLGKLLQLTALLFLFLRILSELTYVENHAHDFYVFHELQLRVCERLYPSLTFISVLLSRFEK